MSGAASGFGRATVLALAVAASVGAVACEPCNGVVGCSSPGQVSAGGQLVDRQETGRPVSGARVTVVRTGGVELFPESLSARTDGEGWWQLRFETREEGEAIVDVAVAPPAPRPPYRVSGVRLRTSRERGVGEVLGRWVAEPHITYIAELRDRATDAPIPGATVTFVRRGGIEVEPTPRTQVTQSTSGIGYFTLDLRPRAYGPLVADFVVEREGQPPARIPNVVIFPQHLYGPAIGQASFRLGLAFAYEFQVIFRGTEETTSGILRYTRTAGPALDPPTAEMYADNDNVYRFDLTPRARGEVTGDFLFTAAFTPDTVSFRNVRLATYDSIGAPRVLLRWGEGLRYAGRLVDAASGAPIPNATLRFRRTGGIALVSDTLSVPTDAAGRFVLRPRTSARGEVTGELTAVTSRGTLPAGTVRLATFAGDDPRPLGDVRAGPAPVAGTR